MIERISIVILLSLALSSCTSQTPSAGSSVPSPMPPSSTSLQVASASFKEGQLIPRQYTCDGVNISPPLEWSGVPKSAKTIALVADDPDAPGGTWVHWVFYNLPAANIGLVENLPADESLKAGGFQGKNDFGKIGYGGPCPPSGTHHYYFKVYAVDSKLSLKAGATKAELLKAMEGHIVGQGQLVGTYAR
jgi:Raf kinase inhibitor-like YbhB/YbcL family protein